MGGPVRQGGDAEGGERLVHPGTHLGVRQAEVQRPERHVLGDGRGEQLVVRVLHHQLDGGTQTGQSLPVVGDGAALDRQLPLTRTQSAAQEPHQRGLSAAVAAEQGERAPLARLEVEAAEHGGTVLVSEGRAPQGEQHGFAHDSGLSRAKVRMVRTASRRTLSATKRAETRASGTRTRRVPS